MAWLWSALGASWPRAGVGEDDLGQIVLDYRREIWLWLAGERTWSQCCSGLIGRITRRIADGTRRGVTAGERRTPGHRAARCHGPPRGRTGTPGGYRLACRRP